MSDLCSQARERLFSLHTLRHAKHVAQGERELRCKGASLIVDASLSLSISLVFVLTLRRRASHGWGIVLGKRSFPLSADAFGLID